MHDVNKLKECFKLAHDVVKDESEPYRTEAFKILYSKLLDSYHKSNEKYFEDSQKLKETNRSMSDKIADFSKQCNVTVQELYDVLYVSDDSIYLITQLDGAEAEKQTIAAQCILTAYDLLFGIEWLEATKLMKCIDSSGIGGLDHFARNMRRQQIFRIRGKGKGKLLEYKISGLGKLQTYQIISDLVRGREI